MLDESLSEDSFRRKYGILTQNSENSGSREYDGERVRETSGCCAHLCAAFSHVCLASEAAWISLCGARSVGQHPEPSMGRVDSAVVQAQQSFKRKKKDDGIIFPDAPWKQKWDVLMMLLILYSSVVVPVP